MKIAMLSTFYPFRGGIAQFNASLYEELQKEHEVKAFTFKRQYPDILFPGETQYVTETDKAIMVPSIEVLDTINPFSYYKTARLINEFEPDLLVMKYWMSFFGPSLGTVAKKMRPKTKVITILDNVLPHERKIIDKPFTNYFLKHNDGFIAMSESVKKDLLSVSKTPPKVMLAEHPDYDHFGAIISKTQAQKILGLDPSKKTLLFFGFIREYKGLDLLIKAFDLLDDSYQLVIAGECYGSFDGYQKLIDQSTRKNDIIVYTKYINDTEVYAYFCGADVCILPYKSATQSGITSISHHFNRPIIATNVGGLQETIHHEQNGLIVDEISENAIANTIRYYFDNHLQTAFESNLEKSKEDKSWANFAKKLVEFSKSL